jgi:hypothetical protein
VDSAWNFQGSYEMTVLKSILVNYNWFDLKPCFSRLINPPAGKVIPVALNKQNLIVYVPKNTGLFVLDCKNYKFNRYCRWINPEDGDSSETFLIRESSDFVKLTPPDTSDWILVVPLESGACHGSQIGPFLYQNYPNPFNASTKIIFKINESGEIKLQVYDIHGRLVKIIVKKYMHPGSYYFNLTGDHFSSGIFLYRLTFNGNLIKSKRMVLLR